MVVGHWQIGCRTLANWLQIPVSYTSLNLRSSLRPKMVTLYDDAKTEKIHCITYFEILIYVLINNYTETQFTIAPSKRPWHIDITLFL